MNIDNESIKRHITDRLPDQILSDEGLRIISFIGNACKKTSFDPNDESMIIYGGSAVVLYRAHIREDPRATKDIDINPYKSDSIDIHFVDAKADKYFQVNNTETFLIEPEWRQRLIQSSTFIDAPYSSKLLLLNPYDIVTTKIGRFEARDVEDCGALIDTYDLDHEVAEALVREAIKYYPLAQNPYNLRRWQENFEEIFDLDLSTPFES